MAKVTAESQNDIVAEPYLYLANVKIHLADHKPMTPGDEIAWAIVHHWQNKIMHEDENTSRRKPCRSR